MAITGNGAEGFVVLKFGGTSVADPGNWPRIAAVLRDRLAEGLRPVVVHSALAGVSDRLEELAGIPDADRRDRLLGEIRDLHGRLAADLDLPATPRLDELSGELERLVSGLELTGEVSPPLQARLMAFGELMASVLVAARLELDGLPVLAVDARDFMRSRPRYATHDPRRFLAATCVTEHDEALVDAWASQPGVVVTQGFIAADDKGRTVLLGRGGSDTSAAVVAARIGARRLEIWTDVPGMFSANPRLIPSARLLRNVSFREAQEIAATGGTVLHPRCMPVARRAGIPLQIFDTRRPEVEGTIISSTGDGHDPRIKAISARRGLTLISMESLGMWHESGFLGRIFAVFAELELSVDLVSTSESVVTVTLDGDMADLEEALLEDLSRRLKTLCKVRILRPCAAVSLVGSRMRANLHRLAPALEAFEEHEIYLVSQAASDLNFTVVIEDDQAERLVRALHGLVVSTDDADKLFGPSWQQLSQSDAPGEKPPAAWWERRRADLLELMEERQSAYVYDRATIAGAAGALTGLRSVEKVFYAIKANPHREVLAELHRHGVGMECVSPGELDLVLEVLPEIDRASILFTPNFAGRDEYETALGLGVRVTVDSLYPLEAWPGIFAGRDILVRMDLNEGTGHHQHVTTAGVRSKFGIGMEDVPRLRQLCEAAGTRIRGLHVHGGSGIRDPRHWRRVAFGLAELAAELPDVEVLDLGGGLGVEERAGDGALDLGGVDAGLAEFRAAFPQYRLWLEPGRYLVSEAGVLLAKVTQTKTKSGTRFVGIATGMNSLIRPALYGAWHSVVNLSRLDQDADRLMTVVGPICESGDRIGRDRLLPETVEGDVLLIANAGAYGHAMSSRYNLREPAEELVV